MLTWQMSWQHCDIMALCHRRRDHSGVVEAALASVDAAMQLMLLGMLGERGDGTQAITCIVCALHVTTASLLFAAYTSPQKSHADVNSSHQCVTSPTNNVTL